MSAECPNRRENILLVGNSGAGKTHLATALAFLSQAEPAMPGEFQRIIDTADLRATGTG
jgi:MoxR-like ATPase